MRLLWLVPPRVGGARCGASGEDRPTDLMPASSEATVATLRRASLSLYHVDRHPRFTPSFAPPDCECDGYAQSPATSLQAEPLSSAAPRVHQPQTFWLQKVASLLTTD